MLQRPWEDLEICSAETPEKFVEGAEEGSIVKNTLGRIYENDSGEVKGQTTTYQIKPGDTLSEIALKNTV